MKKQMKKRNWRTFIIFIILLSLDICFISEAKVKEKNKIVSSAIEEQLKNQIKIAKKAKEKAEDEKKTVAIIKSEPANELVGTFELTAYCSCSYCCGNSDGITKSGTHVTEGRTVACNSIPLGTVIYIEGYGTYTVEDTGAMGDNVIDVYFNSHQTALEFGRQYDIKVYIVK